MAGEGAAALGRAARRAAEQAERSGRKVPAHVQRIERQIAESGNVETSAPPTVRRRMSRGVGYGLAAAGVGTAGGLLLMRHRRRKRDTVAKNLVLVPISKASRDQNSSPPVLRLTARTPQGRYVSHANDLCVVHITPRRNPTSRLGVYTKTAKAYGGAMPATRMAQAWSRKKGVKTGLRMVDEAGQQTRGKSAVYGRNVGRKLTG